ncbi:MAG: hypothetical protein ACLSA2_02880 [Candidatus Gastranaerophilaceae bacterium]
MHSIRFDYANLLAEMGKDEAAVENYKIYITNFLKMQEVTKISV